MNYLYLSTCVNATSVFVMSDRIYICFTSRCMYIYKFMILISYTSNYYNENGVCRGELKIYCQIFSAFKLKHYKNYT